MITYKEQFDKLTRAYISGEVIPKECKACFVGNLLNKTREWAVKRFLDKTKPLYTWSAYNAFDLDPEYNFYTMMEICLMENNFMRKYIGDEDALFIAFESTLELLKQIHISKGEVIDEVPVFKKRQLA